MLLVACCPQLPGACCGSIHQYQRVDRSRQHRKQVSPEESLADACSCVRQAAGLRHTDAAVCYPEALLSTVDRQDAGAKPGHCEVVMPCATKGLRLAHRKAGLLLAERLHCWMRFLHRSK